MAPFRPGNIGPDIVDVDFAARCPGGRFVVASQQHGFHSHRMKLRDRVARIVLQLIGDQNRTYRTIVAVPRGNVNQRLPRRSQVRALPLSVRCRLMPGQQLVAPDQDRRAVDRRLDPKSRFVGKRSGARAPPRPAARATPPALRDARKTVPRRRPAATRRRPQRRRARQSPDGRPGLTVPVLSRTTVLNPLGILQASMSRIRMPRCAPRPMPTISAVGTANPSAHGQAMIKTLHTDLASVPQTSAPPAVRDAPTRTNRSPSGPRSPHLGTKTAAIRSANLCTGGLLDCASRPAARSAQRRLDRPWLRGQRAARAD